MKIEKLTKFKAYPGEVVEIKLASEATKKMAEAAARAAEAAKNLGVTFKMYEHIFEPQAVGIQANEAGDGGLIFLPIGASLRAAYSTCKDLWKNDEVLTDVAFPWRNNLQASPGSKRYRKAAFYTEHRDGRSFSLRRHTKATSSTVTVGKKQAVLRKAARYERDYVCLEPGWEIERVA